MSGKLAGKVAAVTGGMAELGRGIVEACLAEGARVAFNGRDAAKGARAIEELSAGDRALFMTGDASSSADVEGADRCGRGALGTAGRDGQQRRRDHRAGADRGNWPTRRGRTTSSGISASVFMGSSAPRHMLPERFRCRDQHLVGRGKTGVPGMAGYAAAKHGIHGFTKRAQPRSAAGRHSQRDLSRPDHHRRRAVKAAPATATAMG